MEGGQTMSKKIPSEEDFARAKKFMADRYRNLDAVETAVKQRFKVRCPLHNVYLLAQEDVDFRAYVFFETDADVSACKADGTTKALEDAFYDELARYGRGERSKIVVAFEWDSHENVEKNYDGDYLSRLR